MPSVYVYKNILYIIITIQALPLIFFLDLLIKQCIQITKSNYLGFQWKKYKFEIWSQYSSVFLKDISNISAQAPTI